MRLPTDPTSEEDVGRSAEVSEESETECPLTAASVASYRASGVRKELGGREEEAKLSLMGGFSIFGHPHRLEPLLSVVARLAPECGIIWALFGHCCPQRTFPRIKTLDTGRVCGVVWTLFGHCCLERTVPTN